MFIQEITYVPKMKNGAYLVNLDECKSVGNHWIALYVHGNNVTYLNRFGVEYIPKEIKKFIGNKNITKISIEYKPMSQ